MKRIILAFLSILLSLVCFAALDRDTIYIVFKQDTLHQKVTLNHEKFVSKCLFNINYTVQVKSFWYDNSFKQGKDSIITRYQLLFVQKYAFGETSNTTFRKKDVKALENIYRTSLKKKDPCSTEIRSLIVRLKKKSSIDSSISKSHILNSKNEIIYLNSLDNSDDLEKLIRKFFDHDVFIVDISAGSFQNGILYDVRAIPLLPVKAKNNKF